MDKLKRKVILEKSKRFSIEAALSKDSQKKKRLYLMAEIEKLKIS